MTGASAHSEMLMRTWQARARCFDDLDRRLGMIATYARIHSAPILTTDTDFTMMRNAGVALQRVAR
jgi:hypothetical protein